MPTKREREYYRQGFSDGMRLKGGSTFRQNFPGYEADVNGEIIGKQFDQTAVLFPSGIRKPKRKLSAWNKFVKANSRKKEFRYRDGKLNLKKMGVAFRRKKRR
jgi:hypothetical protein